MRHVFLCHADVDDAQGVVLEDLADLKAGAVLDEAVSEGAYSAHRVSSCGEFKGILLDIALYATSTQELASSRLYFGHG